MSNRLFRRQVRIHNVIHTATGIELLIRAVLHKASTRALINAELDRRALGLVPETPPARRMDDSSSMAALAA
jgi:hypothetical protein